MQSRFKYPLLFVLSTIIILTSCSKSNKEGRYIPADAAFVIHLNGQSLSAKLPWEEIKQSELFKMAYEDTTAPAFIKPVLDNPENAGIDIKTDVIIFVMKDSVGSYLAVEGTLKDESKFKKFCLDASEIKAVESEKDGIRFSKTPEMTAAWKKEKFVLVADVNMNKNKYRNFLDSSDAPSPEVKRDNAAIAESIFNLKENKSLGKEDKFTDLMKQKGDVHFWMNTESIYGGGKGLPGMAALSMINLKKIYEGSRVTGWLNFENGMIKADFKTYSGKEMTDLVKKYSGDKINAEMLKSIPSKNLAALFAFNFKPEGLREYLKLLGVDGFANMGTGMLGFTLDDFIKANKGDIVFALTDLSTDSSGKPDFNAIFSASVGDKPSFNKLIGAGNKLFKEKLTGDNGPSVFYNMNERYFAIGNKQPQVDAYLKSNSNTSFDFYNKVSGSAGAFYLDFQYILKSMGTAKKDSFDLAIYDASLKMWNNVVMWGGGFEDGGNIQHVEISLVDKSTNSLKQLNSYMSLLGTLKKKQDEQRPAAFDNTDFSESALSTQ